MLARLADWYRTEIVSRSVLGCTILKFIGPVIFALSLGRPAIPSSSQITSFLLAFALVRSDALEARELSCHMRYTSRCTVALNLMAALYKLRKFLSLLEDSKILGLPVTLLVGTLAFSSCNTFMALESLVGRYVPRMLSGKSGSEPRYPNIVATFRRHFLFLLLLLAGQRCSEAFSTGVLSCAYLATQLLVWGALFCHYNDATLLPQCEPSCEQKVRHVDEIVAELSGPSKGEHATSRALRLGKWLGSWLGVLKMSAVGALVVALCAKDAQKAYGGPDSHSMRRAWREEWRVSSWMGSLKIGSAGRWRQRQM